jgi:hypothetical protein
MRQRELPNYYTILQVDDNAEQGVIEAAYRQLARLYHPDINIAADAKERMQSLNDAYAVLRDPQRRAQYDASRHRQRRWSARLAEAYRDGDWILFRLGSAPDAFHTIAALEKAIPPLARRWDAPTQYWYVHVAYMDVLSHLFADFGAPLTAPPPPPVLEKPNAPMGPQLTAAVICLVAVAILLYLAETPPARQWRGQTWAAFNSALNRIDPSLAVGLSLVFLAALAALVVGYIAWTLSRPTHPPRR